MFNKYQIIKGAVNYELANFIFNYFLLKRDAVKYMYDNNIIHDNGMFGTWGDTQIPNTYSHYADPVMETLLMKVLPVMKNETGLDLCPTYSYARIYKKMMC
jgi:adenosyl cobinamide kinase/adenosyl cobinamide phosphate guanylyltransferase